MGRMGRPATGRVAIAAVATLVTGGLMGALVASGSASPAALSTGKAVATITVTGTGSATATPNEMTLSIGVTHSAARALDALGGDNTETARLVHVLRAGGIPARDLQTTALQLNPTYDSSGNVTGYQASDQLSVTVDDLARAGALVDDAAAAVGNDVTIENIAFAVAHPSRLVATARAAAVRDAATTATALAHATGERLGPVRTIKTHADQAPPAVLPYGPAMATPSKAAAVPVQAGTSTVHASVTVVYTLVP